MKKFVHVITILKVNYVGYWLKIRFCEEKYLVDATTIWSILMPVQTHYP